MPEPAHGEPAASVTSSNVPSPSVAEEPRVRGRARQLVRGERQRPRLVDHEQVGIAVAVVVAPGEARAHVLRQLRGALAVEVDEAHPGLRRLVAEEGAGRARDGGPVAPPSARRAPWRAAPRRSAGVRMRRRAAGRSRSRERVISALVSASRAGHVRLAARPRQEDGRASPARTAGAATPIQRAARRRWDGGRAGSGPVTGEAWRAAARRGPAAGPPRGAGLTRMRASARAISVTGMVRPAFSPNMKLSRYWSTLR